MNAVITKIKNKFQTICKKKNKMISLTIIYLSAKNALKTKIFCISVA